MKALPVILILILFRITSFSQTPEKVYLDRNWLATRENKADYTREITKDNDSLYIIKEFAGDNQLLLQGEYSSVSPLTENGKFIFYDPETFKKLASGYYDHGTMAGQWVYFGPSGDSTITNYDFQLKSCQQASDSFSNEVFFIAENMPKFNHGGLDKFSQYVAENLHYPPMSRIHGSTGRVFVQFTVNENGDVCDVRTVRSSEDKDLDREAVKIIAQSPKWEPGKMRGKPVRVSFTFPLNFMLE